MKEIEETVKELLKKAANTLQPQDAMHFAQAALSAAHVRHALDKH